MRAILTILVFGLFRPRWTAERTQSAGRATVWAAHLLGVVFGAVVLCAGWAWAALMRWTLVTNNLGYLQPVSGAPSWQSLRQELLVVTLVALPIGAALAWFAALIVLPFAWRDEPLGDTWRHAFRMARLFSPIWMPLAALTVACMIIFAGISGSGPTFPQFLLFLSFAVLPVLCINILGRAVSADRSVNEPAHEPLCESCGYLLHHVPQSRRCPECGEGVNRSLDRWYRWYPPREGDEHATLEPIFAVTGISAWTRPRVLFRRVRMDIPTRSLILRVALAHAVAAAVWWLGMFFGFMLIEGDLMEAEVMGMFAVLFTALAVGFFGLWCAGVGVVGLIAGAQAQRNLVHAALTVAAYLSTFHVFAAAVSVVAFVGMIALLESGIVRNAYWPVMGFFSVAGVLALTYIVGVWRRMRYLRFGNWHFQKSATVNPEPTLADAETP